MRAYVLSAVVLASLATLNGCSADAASEDGSAAQEVVTRRCPDTLKASFSGLDAYSFSEIEQQTGFALSDDEKTDLRDPLREIETVGSFAASLKLETAANAECKYTSATAGRDVTAKFYTKDGKNILRIDSNERATAQLSFYVTLKDYSKESVEMLYPNAAIFFRGNAEVGFNPWKVGSAAQADVSVGGGELPGPALSDNDLEAQLKQSVEGVEFISESEAPFSIFRAPIAANEAVSADLVKQKFNGMPGTDDQGVALKDLVGKDESDFEHWFQSDFAQENDADESYAAYYRSMHKVYDLMKASCTDLKIVYAAGSDLTHTHDVGWVQLFIVGRTRNGTLIGLHTGAAWT
jgi:hypothetical protein